MPIHCPIRIRNLTKAEFDERDRIVMRCAYASQNELGRLCDERVYENDLAGRLKAEGVPEVHTQVPVTVVNGGFEKNYLLDLVADHALYELKAVTALTGEHDAQALHYAMLEDVSHAKLLNFRTVRVQGRLRFTPLTLAQRRQIDCEDSRWRDLSLQCAALKHRMMEVAGDWGAFLDSRLYEEALIHACGGEERCVARVPVVRDGIELGTHRIQSHGDGLCFIVTAFTSHADEHRRHIERLLRLIRLRGVQWINLNHATIQFVTIERSAEWGQPNKAGFV